MLWRYYLAPLVPATWLPLHLGKDPDLRGNKLGTIIDTRAGEGYHDCLMDARAATLCLCWAEQAKHDAADADSEIWAISPLFSSSKEAESWRSGSDKRFAPDIAKNVESFGIPMDWMTGATTARDVFIFLRRLAFIEQVTSPVDVPTPSALGTASADRTGGGKLTPKKRSDIQRLVGETTLPAKAQWFMGKPL